MNRKNMPLLIGGVVALLLLAALGYGLFNAKGHYTEDMDALQSESRKLQRLTSRDPFPSEPNVKISDKQLDIYDDYLVNLFSEMRKGQTSIGAVDGDRFRRVLEDVLRRLFVEARNKSVVIPTAFPFGFHRYVEGALPVAEELPRLLNQLQSVAVLCGILYDSGISELLAVERTVFERDAQMAQAIAEEDTGRRRRRGEPEPEVAKSATDLYQDPDGLFTKEHYALIFRARDEAVWKLLDRLSKGSPFIVVTKLEITNAHRPAVVAPPTEAETAPAGGGGVSVAVAGWQSPGMGRGPAVQQNKAPEILPRDLRIVAGNELPTIRIELDLYRFAEEAAVEEGQETP